MPFALELPTRDRSASGIPETPRQLRGWLRRLPTAEPCDTAGAAADVIEAQNQLALHPQRRLHLLELVRPATRAPLDALAARVQVQSAPLPARTAEVAQLTRRLLEALLAGYQTVAAASPVAHANRRAVALVSERALHLRGELLLRHVEADEPVPADFWQHSYAMYARAEAAGVDNRPVADKQWQGRRRPTPTDAFVSLLLLALAQPRGLRSGEAARIQGTIQEWCREARLAPAAMAPPDAAERGSVFAVALDAVTAPSQWRLRPGEGRVQDRVLDAARVVARVEQRLESADATGAHSGSDAIGPTGLKRLLDNWNPRPLGDSSAGMAAQPVTAVFGIEAIQQRLEGRGDPVGARKPPKRTYSQLRPGEILQTIADDDAGPARAAYPHARAAVDAGTTARPAARSETASETPAASDWLLEEADANGFRLRWQGSGRSQATVGAIVAVRTAGPHTNGWRVGVVRWLQFLDDEHFAIGCESLSSRPRGATLRHEPLDRHRSTHPRGEGVAAILLPGADDRAAGSSVLLPANRFRGQDILELDVGEHTVRVQLSGLREHSTRFTLFSLAPAPARGRTSGVPEGPARGAAPAG